MRDDNRGNGVNSNNKQCVHRVDKDATQTNDDYALLKLATPLKKNASIRFACLPFFDTEDQRRTAVVTAGWGVLEEGNSVCQVAS